MAVSCARMTRLPTAVSGSLTWHVPYGRVQTGSFVTVFSPRRRAAGIKRAANVMWERLAPRGQRSSWLSYSELWGSFTSTAPQGTRITAVRFSLLSGRERGEVFLKVNPWVAVQIRPVAAFFSPEAPFPMSLPPFVITGIPLPPTTLHPWGFLEARALESNGPFFFLEAVI